VTHGQCDARPTVTFPAAERHRPLAGTKLYCLVTEAHGCEQPLTTEPPSHQYSITLRTILCLTISWTGPQSTVSTVDIAAGMRSSRTVLDLEDTSRTKNRGLGLGLGLDALSSRVWPPFTCNLFSQYNNCSGFMFCHRSIRVQC